MMHLKRWASMGKSARLDRLRAYVAGLLFRLAGKVHQSYDVWLDDAPRRRGGRSG